MSLPVLLFLATPETAAEVDFSVEFPPSEEARLGSIDTLKLSMLHAIVEGLEWDDKMMDAFTEIKTSDHEWTYLIPKEFTDDLREANLQETSIKWANTEEMSCEPKDARFVIDEIIRMSLESNRTGKDLFIYMTL